MRDHKKRYCLSKYLKIYDCTLPVGCSLLFSTWKASLAYVPNEILKALQFGEEISSEHEKDLRSLGMLVDGEETERRAVFGFFDELNREDHTLQATIILNLRCNFSCAYCYEGKLKSNRAMTLDIVDRTIAFLKGRFGEEKNELILHFYGGEPLLDEGLIKRFASELKPFAESRGGSFKFTLVTNGSLLTKAIVERLVPYGLTDAKVTLDGPKETHDRSRPFKNGNGSFDAIVENLKTCSHIISISVSGNFTREYYKVFSELVDYLVASGLGPDRIKSLSFGPVMQVRNEFSTPEHQAGCCSVNEPWVTDATLRLRRAILEHGFKAVQIMPSPCMVDVADALTVHVDGSITKCPALIGHAKFKVGDIQNGLRDYHEIFNVDSWRNNSECSECEYLPLCFGGCRMMLYQMNGTIAGVDCKRTHYDSVLELLLKQDIELGNLP